MKKGIGFGKNPRDQATEQALRRLKYLHTSLTNARAPKSRASNLKPLQTTSYLPITGLQTGNDEENESLDTNGADKRCFLSLEPENARKDVGLKKNERNLKTRFGWRPVRTGRVPLMSSTAHLKPTFSPISTKNITQMNSSNTERRASQSRARTTKSAPTSVDPEQYNCPECFANDFDHFHKNGGPKYYTNMKINRVTFSARPRSKTREIRLSKNTKASRKGLNEKASRIPQTLHGGWGVRTVMKRNNLRNSRDSRDTLDVTMGLQTLKLEPRGMESNTLDKGHEEAFLPPPPAPPTPVRQIDIKMPEGYLVQFRLQTVA